MAALGFMESFALGYIAAGSGPDMGSATAGILSDLGHKRDLAQADADYTALVNEYNRLVDGFNQLYRAGLSLEAEVASQSERVASLEPAIADANQRATVAEQRAAVLTTREAEARRDATFYKERYHSARNLLSVHASRLDEAQAEIARLEAIIAGMPKG